MTLVQARCMEDPWALRAELRHHGRRGALVGLAVAEEWSALRQAVLGWPKPSGMKAVASDEPPASATALAAGPDGELLQPAKLGPGLTRAEPALGLRQALSAWGPAVVLGSGGSSGGRRWCLQPLRHLEASAEATAAWLAAEGLDPAACLHLAALPLHHVSGLLPLIRCECWGAELRWLSPSLLRRPDLLPDACALPAGRPVLLSLVPTQLRRLLASPAATAWLAQCSVIWVGGAALPEDLARQARQASLPLAPCYGATETAAMVCALPPARFLAGVGGCGPVLADVELRLQDPVGAIALRTRRLSPGWWDAGCLRPFAAADGWWRSGDAGRWEAWAAAAGTSLVVQGRLDGAIHSGGETVFPEQVRQRLLGLIEADRLPVAELLLLAEDDRRWGQRLVALVKLEGASVDCSGDASARGAADGPAAECLSWLERVARQLPPPQRPGRWLLCPDLATSGTGKWELGRWRAWLKSQPAAHG